MNFIGRLAQRLERSVYTRKVVRSNRTVPTIQAAHSHRLSAHLHAILATQLSPLTNSPLTGSRRWLTLFPIPQGAISSGELRKIGYFHSGGFKYLRYELSRIDLIATRPLSAYIYPVIWSRGLQVALSLAPVRDRKKVTAKVGANG